MTWDIHLSINEQHMYLVHLLLYPVFRLSRDLDQTAEGDAVYGVHYTIGGMQYNPLLLLLLILLDRSNLLQYRRPYWRSRYAADPCFCAR